LFTIKLPPEWTYFDFITFGLGSMKSLKTIWPELLKQGDFRKEASTLDLPVYFAVGKYDYNIPFELTESYYNILKAPYKELIWFEKSAHMPNVEEPEKFNDLLINKILKETYF